MSEGELMKRGIHLRRLGANEHSLRRHPCEVGGNTESLAFLHGQSLVAPPCILLHRSFLLITYWEISCQSVGALSFLCVALFQPLSNDLGVEAVTGADFDGLGLARGLESGRRVVRRRGFA